MNCFASSAQDQRQTPAPTSAQTPSTAMPSASAAAQTSPQAQAPSSATAEALARKYFDAWNTGDKATIDSFPAFTMHNHGGHVVVGSGMLERVITAWRHSMPDLTFTIDDTVAQGNEVVMRVTLRGTYKELLFPEANLPKSPPRPIRASGILMFKIKNGKIQDIWQELDEGAMMTQMGAQWKTRQELEEEDAASKSKK
jgi:predicted ester cyclase